MQGVGDVKVVSGGQHAAYLQRRRKQSKSSRASIIEEIGGIVNL
jgi:hypothetical protein